MERKYQIYTEMTRKIEKIINHLMTKYNCLHESFIAVSDEDERLYFWIWNILIQTEIISGFMVELVKQT